MWTSGGETALYAWPYCERTQMWEGKRRAKDGDVNRNNKEGKHRFKVGGKERNPGN